MAREGVLQVDLEDLPPQLREGKWNSAYRYVTVPYTLKLNVERVEPRILADSFLDVYLRPEELVLQLVSVFDIQKAGVFRLDLQLPTGFDLRSVRGVGGRGVEPLEVDRYFLDTAAGNRLFVSLSRKVQGKVGLLVELVRTLSEPDLLSPTGKTVLLDLPLPSARGGTFVEREQGRLVVYAPESLRVDTRSRTGLRPITYTEAGEAKPGLVKPAEKERPCLSFAYSEPPIALQLAAERRAPYLTARQLLVIRVEPGVIKYDATFFYDILYSGVKFLRLDIPKSLASEIRITTPGIRYATLEGATNDLAASYLPWRIEGEKEFLGSVRFDLRWEEKLEKLDIGSTAVVRIPRVIPRSVDRAWGQIVLAKAETIDVTPSEDSRGLTAIDPRQDLMTEASVRDAALAFEFHDEWILTQRITRYQPQEVKTTSIERGLVRMVVTRGGTTSVQALYRMRSLQQRVALRIPGRVTFESQPLRIDGRPVTLEQGAAGEYFVPLAAQAPDTQFVLELRYVVTGGGMRLMVPEFPGEPAVQQIYLFAFIPQNRTYLGHRGPWTPEWVWTLRGFNALPRPRHSAENLIRWVTSHTKLDQGSLGNFPIEGQQLLFSALRPAHGTRSSLSLVTIPRWLFQSLLLGAIIVIGLVLVPASAAARAVTLGGILALLAVVGIFAPTFVRATVNNASVAAALVILVVWVLWFFWSLCRAANCGRNESTCVQKDGVPEIGPTPPRAHHLFLQRKELLRPHRREV
ncbi:MAG: hypothetical protein ACUVWX_10170 [Kiritimatiellia bacterium]